MLKSLFDQMIATADKTAIIDSHGCTTYKQLWHSVHMIHHALKERASNSDFVCVFLPGSHWFMAATLASIGQRKTYIPVDPDLAATRLPAIIAQTNSVVITNQKYAGFVPTGVECLVIERMEQTAPCCPQLSKDCVFYETPTDEQTLYSIFTSGTTGEPKGALVHYAGFANLLQWYVKEVALNAQDIVLIASSIGFDLTQKNLFATLQQGGTLVFVPLSPFDAFEISEVISRQQVSLINCTPSTLGLITDTHAISGFHSLKRVVLGGEPIGHELMQRWHHYLPKCKVLNSYGPTECTDVVAAFWLTPAHVEQSLPIPIGYAIDNVALTLSDMAQDEQGRDVGEITISGVCVGQGYIKSALNTAFDFSNAPFSYRTGDLGYLENGQLFYVGRKDRQIKYNGCLVNLAEIESCLLAQPHVQNAYVGYYPAHNALVAWLQLNNDAALTEIQFHVRTELPSYMQPNQWQVRTAFPLTASNKVDGRALMATLFETRDESTSLVGNKVLDTTIEASTSSNYLPESDFSAVNEDDKQSEFSDNAIASFLANNVLEITGIVLPAVNAPLADFGLNSIQTVQLLNRINRHYGLRIAPRELIHLPDLRAVVQLVDDRCKQNNQNNDVIMSF